MVHFFYVYIIIISLLFCIDMYGWFHASALVTIIYLPMTIIVIVNIIYMWMLCMRIIIRYVYYPISINFVYFYVVISYMNHVS